MGVRGGVGCGPAVVVVNALSLPLLVVSVVAGADAGLMTMAPTAMCLTLKAVPLWVMDGLASRYAAQGTVNLGVRVGSLVKVGPAVVVDVDVDVEVGRDMMYCCVRSVSEQRTTGLNELFESLHAGGQDCKSGRLERAPQPGHIRLVPEREGADFGLHVACS